MQLMQYYMALTETSEPEYQSIESESYLFTQISQAAPSPSPSPSSPHALSQQEIISFFLAHIQEATVF